MVKLRDIILTCAEYLTSRNQQNLNHVGISIRKEVTFGPDNAMNGLARCGPDRANWISFGCLFCITIVAFGFTLLRMSFGNRSWSDGNHLFYHLHLPVESSGSTLDQDHVCC